MTTKPKHKPKPTVRDAIERELRARKAHRAERRHWLRSQRAAVPSRLRSPPLRPYMPHP